MAPRPNETLRCFLVRLIYWSLNNNLPDVELSAIAEHLPLLQQLSIMGTRNVTPRAVIAMAQTLTSLKLLDVGYCEQVYQGCLTPSFLFVCVIQGVFGSKNETGFTCEEFVVSCRQ